MGKHAGPEKPEITPVPVTVREVRQTSGEDHWLDGAGMGRYRTFGLTTTFVGQWNGDRQELLKSEGFWRRLYYRWVG